MVEPPHSSDKKQLSGGYRATRLESSVILAHSIALDPNRRQSDYFARAVGTARFAYNNALAMWSSAYKVDGKVNPAKLQRDFNATRQEVFPWMNEVSSYVYAYPWIQLRQAFSAFFRKTARYPKFRAKHRNSESFYVHNKDMWFDGKKLHLGPKKFALGTIGMREKMRLEGKVMGATIRRDVDRWVISVQVDVGEYHRERVSDGVVGVDLGITTLATLSTGEKIAGSKPLKKILSRLRRASRRHSKKKKGSNNREKSRFRLAKLHRHIRNIRKDALHRLTTKLCRENQAVVIEDLSVRGMMRNRRLARHIADMGWYEFRRQMEYKCLIYGTKLTVADRFFPSSKRCSDCGVVCAELKLGDRTYRCPSCGFELDRDLNAAINLLNLVPVNDGELGSGRTRTRTPVERKALAATCAAKLRLAETGTCGCV